jgi:hypothetical protein
MDLFDPVTVYETTERMKTYGGSFVKSLADTIRSADPYNQKRIFSTFPEILENYGPRGPFK